MNKIFKSLVGASLCSLMLTACGSDGGGEFLVQQAQNLPINKTKYEYPSGSPVAQHGALKVNGLQLCDAAGKPVQLAGFSTMGWQWCENCYTEESIKNLVDDWHINILRLAMYVEEGGYNKRPNHNLAEMCKLVDICGKLGIYCIVDWHILTPGNPLDPIYGDAAPFFKYMSRKYAGAPHVIFEICNEPNGTEATWEVISEYANKVIPEIYAPYDSIGAQHPLVICGTPQWDQLVDASLVKGRYQGNEMDFVDLPADDRRLKFDNVIYTFHFYASSHNEGSPKDGVEDYYNFYKYMYKVLGQLPVFCSEYGLTEASGDGNIDTDRTDKWIHMFMGNNAGNQKVSFCNWSYSDKDEKSAALKPFSCSRKAWNNTTKSGEYVRRVLNVVNNGATDPTVLKPENVYKPECKAANACKAEETKKP